MEFSFTLGSQRALASAAAWGDPDGRNELAAPALLLGLLAEPECRAAAMLARHQIDAQRVRDRWPELVPRDQGLSLGFSMDIQFSLRVAMERLAEYPQPLELATEHVLLGLAAADHEVSLWLCGQGVDPHALEAEIHKLYGHCPGPLPLEQPETEPTLPHISRPNTGPPQAGEEIRVLRIIDAAANRAREGLRAVEDFVRFVLDDRHLTEHCKQLRHELTTILSSIPLEHRMAARETQADVGTSLSTSGETRRESAAAVFGANLTRLQEALRSLEEFGKLLDPGMAAALKQLRYRSYTLQRAVETTRTGLERLAQVRLYVLIDGGESLDAFRQLAEQLVAAGVDVLQLRDKNLKDRRLLQRARLLREVTSESETLLIINDRPDLAVLARADGVHVGQEELSVKDARTIVGPEALIGVSTHSIEQARQAVLDGANYLGVGPTFPSGTKHFEEFPGIELVKAVASEIRLPAFAIGGITRENVAEVRAAGFSRIAVSGAITTANDPAAAARELSAALHR